MSIVEQSQKKDFIENQKKIEKFWDDNKIYKLDQLNKNKNLFSIDTPPPTVSGKLHIGHIFSYTQTDLIARYKRISGFNVYYPFGFDDNGLPTERYVEKERGVTSHTVGRAEFVKICLEETKKAHLKFESLWRTIGLSVDWSCSYSTISKEVQRISQQSFIDLYKKGYIYKKDEPALFCTAFRTSVSQAELESVEKETVFSEIPFVLDSGEKVIIATTRPELLGACVALFFNPNDDRYKHLEGKEVAVPLYNHKVKIIADTTEHVVVDKGTGIVMCCTFGDSTDVLWFKEFKLPYVKIIDIDGKITHVGKFLEGLPVAKAREVILEKLKENNLIINQKKIVHAVSIYERSKKEIEYIMLPQWFCNVLDNKQKLIEMGNCINWHPSHMKQRYVDWVQNLAWDWCISRQRYFGIPFPVWYDKNGNIILADEKQLPVDPLIDKPFDYDNQEIFGDTDVMDTWNTSALTPYIVKELYEKNYENTPGFIPMSMRPQAHDIIRTWAFGTITKAFMTQNCIPWNDIVISGHVLASSKEKISKSQSNAPTDPIKLLEAYPADAIRFWTATTKLGIDTAFSEEQFKTGLKVITKLKNAAIFVQQHIAKENECNEQIFRSPNQLVNQWMLDQLLKTYKKYCDGFDSFESSVALEAVQQCFWNYFCDNYLEIIKHQLFNPQLYNQDDVLETKKTVQFIFISFLSLYSPFLIYTTEELYQQLMNLKFENSNSIHTFALLSIEAIKNNYNDNDFDSVISCIDQIRKLKSKLQISIKSPLEVIDVVYDDEQKKKIIESQELIIKRCCHVENFIFIQKNDKVEEINNKTIYI